VGRRSAAALLERAVQVMQDALVHCVELAAPMCGVT
jgi:hypothetical protein